MGSIASQQNSEGISQRSSSSTLKVNKNWKVLEKSFERQILQSKKTELIMERYWFQIQHHEDFQSQNKLFQWRNTNPNSQTMINVLSVGKDQSITENSTVECGAINWCPSERIVNKVYVVTERILKVQQLSDFLNAKKQIESNIVKNKCNVLYSTDDKTPKIINEAHKKFKPFLELSLTQHLIIQLIKDWLRGIEVLCYKFGYFKVTPQLLGITARMRGTVWITNNYAQNHLAINERVQVSTAEQKFKYEKDTVQKILKFIDKIEEWKGIAILLKNCEKFQQVLNNLQRLQTSHKKVLRKQNRRQNNSSLFVEQGSFMNQNNISILRFDHNNVLQRLHSDKKLNSQERFSLFNSSKLNEKNLVSSTSNRSATKKSMKRSNTGDKGILKNLSPQNKQLNQVFIDSGHKYGGRQTAPTNELGHSSSLQSVNHLSQRGNIQIGNLTKEGEKLLLAKSQNDNQLIVGAYERNPFAQQAHMCPNHKIYYPNHNQRSCLSCEPHIFRSQANISMDLNYKSPRLPTAQVYHQKHSPRQKNSPKQNYSLDQINMIGPYRTDRIYSNFKKQKIAMVDSMVMVRQQSQSIDQQFHNGQKNKIIMEESIIIRGKQDQSILSSFYQ